METFYYRVSAPLRSRVVKVQAQTREQAETAARDRMDDDMRNVPPQLDEYPLKEVSADDFDDDADSIIAIPVRDPSDYFGYNYAEDDPAGRGAG
jgi:hypothetical protein